MSQDVWTDVDRYITDLFVPADAALEATLAAADAAGLPAIHVTPNQGKLLMLLARAIGARRVLEIGTLAGYSTIWLARGLVPGGRLITLELDERRAELARENLGRAGIADTVNVRVGPALDSLHTLVAESGEPFDLVFIDADKPNTPEYFRQALKLTKRGSLIIADNIVRKGAVVDPMSQDVNVQGIRHFHEVVADCTSVTATAIQTVGSKGYDGMTIVLVTDDPQ